MNKRAHYAFVGLFLVGAILRIAVGTQSLGFVHPDEHQQYLEAANRVAYGYGVMFWEYERGVRNYLYPACLAAMLHTLDFIGLTTPIVQAQVIRSFMGLAVLSSLACYAHRWLREGKAIAAFSLLALSCFSPYFLFVGARTLSETAIIPMIVLMMYWSDRRPVLSGLVGGLMFGVRFQAALFVAPFFVAGCVKQYFAKSGSTHGRYRRCFDFVLGAIIGLVAIGAIDYFTWSAWFHSPIAYFQANILEKVAASFGVRPWHQYAQWLVDTAFDTSILFIPLAAIGARYKPQYAFAAIVFFIAHSIVGHKESRFIWPLVPVALILISEGLGRLGHGKSLSRQFILGSLGALLLLCSTLTHHNVAELRMKDSEANTLAIAWVGRQRDISGVAVLGCRAYSGNLFYLRQNVPYIVEEIWDDIETTDEWIDHDINYLVAQEAPNPQTTKLTHLRTFDRWSVYRVEHNTTKKVAPNYASSTRKRVNSPATADLITQPLPHTVDEPKRG